jgi:hypothetical protein
VAALTEYLAKSQFSASSDSDGHQSTPEVKADDLAKLASLSADELVSLLDDELAAIDQLTQG